MCALFSSQLRLITGWRGCYLTQPCTRWYMTNISNELFLIFCQQSVTTGCWRIMLIITLELAAFCLEDWDTRKEYKKEVKVSMRIHSMCSNQRIYLNHFYFIITYHHQWPPTMGPAQLRIINEAIFLTLQSRTVLNSGFLSKLILAEVLSIFLSLHRNWPN